MCISSSTAIASATGTRATAVFYSFLSSATDLQPVGANSIISNDFSQVMNIGVEAAGLKQVLWCFLKVKSFSSRKLPSTGLMEPQEAMVLECLGNRMMMICKA